MLGNYACTHPNCNKKFTEEKLVNGKMPDHQYTVRQGGALVTESCPYSRRVATNE